MQLTPKLKSWVLKNTDLVESDSEEDFRKAVGNALANDELTTEKFMELSITKEDEEASGLKSFLSNLGDTLGEMRDLLLEDSTTKSAGKTKTKPEDDEEEESGEEDDEEEEGEKSQTRQKPPKLNSNDNASGDVFGEELNKDREKEEQEGKPAKGAKVGTKKSQPSQLERLVVKMSNPMAFSDDEGEKSLGIRVKEAADQYSTTKSAMTYPEVNDHGRKHPFAGRPVRNFGFAGQGERQLDNPSDRDRAIAGAYAKFAIAAATKRSKSLALASLPQHDRELLLYALENEKWGGCAEEDGDRASVVDRKLTHLEQKAVIDDSTSGGVYAAPIVFDDMVIQTPLLNGELFPLVNLVPVDRGRRIEGISTGTVTGGWGGIDDAAISLFSTASYVSAFDTTIFRWQGAIRIGLDFLSDTPIDFGQHVTYQYGERLLEDLDDVIAVGDGTTQPEGVMTKSGTTSVSFGGSTTIGGYESLRFGVAKQEHKANLVASAVFCGTETSYQRAKAIPVGASDARRLSQTTTMPTYGDYMWMDRPYKINNSLTNAQIFYAILGRYRMYMRRGLTMRTSTEGDTLIRNNEMLLTATARYGGQLERGGVAAVTSSAPA